MTKPAFTVEQAFGALLMNEPDHTLLTVLTYSRDLSSQSGKVFQYSLPERSLRDFLEEGTQSTFELASINRLVVFPPRQRQFRQRTYPGKPLSDERAIQAAQVAGELEDDLAIRRQLGR
jgi:hypothetical protein